MTRKEVPGVLQRVEGACGMHKLMAELMYGSGVRVKECCRTRVKDVDLERLQLGVRGGKGDQDRVTSLTEPRDLTNEKFGQRDTLASLVTSELAVKTRIVPSP